MFHFFPSVRACMHRETNNPIIQRIFFSYNSFLIFFSFFSQSIRRQSIEPAATRWRWRGPFLLFVAQPPPLVPDDGEEKVECADY